VDREAILVNWRRGEKDRASDDAWNAALRGLTNDWLGLDGRDQVPKPVGQWLVGGVDVYAFVSHRISLDEVLPRLRTGRNPGQHPHRDRLRTVRLA
jgi:hypothetical protein